ncbi:MAG: hypothetical protein IJZ81_04890 [Clostridia bacterium]|nr:hypothetical protein [Clostridia bacterium]
MQKNTPNDSILLPEGYVEDDPKAVFYNEALVQILEEGFSKKDREEIRRD